MSEPQGLDNGLTNYGDRDFARYLRRSMARSMGISKELLGKPVIGIATSPSQFNNCHRYMPQLAEAVARGVLAAGGLPREFPTISLGEVFLNPTSMVFRNLMAMDVEEMIRAQPMDAVVLIGGCDKTVPAQLMGAASAGRPAIQLVTGPMMTGRHKGERLGACTDCRRFWGRFRAGDIDATELEQVEGRLASTAGTCAVMGTASTMACITEALGIALPGTAAIPAVDSQRLVAAEETGKTAVWLAHHPITPDRIITRESVENAFRLLMALGGSTNAIVHLTAVAGRLGIRISAERLNQISDETPVLVDLKPVGDGYMEDLHAAGGVGAVLRELRPLLNLDCLTVDGSTLRQRLDEPAGWIDRKVVRAFEEPVSPVGGLIVLSGNLAPDGAIFKRAAATPPLFEVEGRAVVFEGLEDLAARIDDPDLDVKADDVLVLKNAGPHGAGMPEAGYLPIPSKLARAGVKDMVRVSDARMSGTAYGTIVLHVAPEAAVGGPLAAVRNGDRIRLSVSNKRIELLVDDEEVQRRLAQWSPPPKPTRGYAALYRNTVLQAPEGCDLDFLVGGPPVDAAVAADDLQRGAQSILIVDDVPMNLEIITAQLVKRGYVALVARSGEEAVERAESARPDLILLDVLMPGIDGFETCRRLKQREATRDIPVIFMTALTAIDDKIAGFRVGAVDYVTKPINAEEVATRVETHLKLDALRQRQAAQNRQLREEIAAREQEMRSKREEAREDERKHIARELHDELGQHLSAIRLELSFVRMRWGTDNPELREKVQSVQETIDGVIGLVRDLVARLRPVVLDMGIASALEWLTCEFRTSSEVTCELQIDEQVTDLDPWQTSTVFRLVQESLTNIGRHARARNVQVSLQRQPLAYVLTVSDDGLGFDPAKIGIKSLGIQGMRERAEMLGGQLELRTRPGDGTRIVVTFPIGAAAA